MTPQTFFARSRTLMVLLLLCLPFSAQALDTDIYQANVKQNAYILLDNSHSMDFGVYESSINYADMFDTLYNNPDVGDTIMNSGYFLTHHEERNKIYLLKGNIGVTIYSIDGEDQAFTGDAADPDYLWYSNNIVDTHTIIDSAGNLTAEDGFTARVTVDGDGHILLDGELLPLGMDILQHDYQSLYDGSVINQGFGGLLNAPGYYFSGFEAVGNNAAGHNEVEDQDVEVFYFVTGNWINMQQMYNLHYTSNPGPHASIGDPAWKYEEFDITSDSWAITDYALDYPSGAGNYVANLVETDTDQTITHAGAGSIQIHFSMFDVAGNNNVNTFTKDYIALYDANNNQVAKYDNDNPPADGWSPEIPGDTVHIKLKSNNDALVGAGYTVDQYRTVDASGAYLMQNRLDVAKDAMLYVVDEFRGKINWGIGKFAYQGANPNGATFGPLLNPTDNDDTNRAAIVSQLNNTEPQGNGSPLGEALQDVFETGYYGRRNSLNNLTCRKNYAIVVSDGYPSGDDDWSRINGVTISDADGDGFTADPYQYNGSPPANYYDDVAHWIYTHSWLDKSEIASPETSYENVIPHQISFGSKHPLMQNAAEESGAEFIAAYNKAQLVNAFYSLGLMISEAVSFTAPVVSVDEANKVQNGDDLYMGQFLPMDSGYWPGNVKHFKLGDGTVSRPDIWQIYDGANNAATDSNGRLLDDKVGFWGDSNDANDSNNYGSPEITEDGVGEVLTERVLADYIAGDFFERNIKTYSGGSLIDFTQANVTPDSLGLAAADTLTRNKTVNWVYGYSFDADAGTGNPVGVRDWSLGAIVHSRPTVIDYYDDNDYSVLETRYIATGSDDGMLHIFDNTDGSEVFAFIPEDLLTNLPAFETIYHQSMVDGSISLFRGEDGQPKYLFFGLRRGGNSFWRIEISDSDPSTWTVAQFTDAEMGQSWSDIEFAKVRTAANTFADVAIFSGGYDPVEDSFPEPFDDLNNNGTPYANNGNLDNQEWDSNNSDQDVYNNNQYDISNPAGDSKGRAIYIVDVESLNILFSVQYGAANLPLTQGSFSATTSQTRTDFTYCFPASPSVVTESGYYSYEDSGDNVYDRVNDALAAIYAPDIYGNLFRITYDYGDPDGDGTGDPKWQVKHIFSANPGSDNDSAELRQGDDTSDKGRKVFYGPAVSWAGSGRYFDISNYYYTAAEFFNTRKIASVFFGTGDREHPSYKLVKNRVYAIYDDSPIYAKIGNTTVDVSSVPYTEDDLLNITCDELGINTSLVGLNGQQTAAYKLNLETTLMDDVLNPDLTEDMELQPSGLGENDAKGWYIILEKQGLSPYCDHCDYEATIDSSDGGRDNHFGEAVLSKLTLFSKILYFTTYQPAIDDPCSPEGNAFNYALNYVDGSAGLNLNEANDANSGDDTVRKDVTDRYGKFTGVKGIPSGFEIVVRDGEAGAMSSIGGSIVGGGEDGYEIPISDLGIDLYYWIEK